MHKQLYKLFVCIVDMSFNSAQEIAEGAPKADFASKLKLTNQQLRPIFSFLPVTVITHQR